MNKAFELMSENVLRLWSMYRDDFLYVLSIVIALGIIRTIVAFFGRRDRN